jgi:putative transposase
VSGQTKLELLGLVDGAVAAGWAHARACRVLEIGDVRVHRWLARLAETGSMDDRPPVGTPVHRMLDWEERAILDLTEESGPVDRAHRKLAHRGSYVGKVFVSPSTLLRVALRHQVVLLGEPFRPRPALPAFREVPWERNRIWIWDATHFTRCKRVAYAIVDVVTRYWIAYLLSVEQTTTQAQLLFARALGRPGSARSGRRAGQRRSRWADPGGLVGQRVGDDRYRHPPVHGADDNRPAPRPAGNPN